MQQHAIWTVTTINGLGKLLLVKTRFVSAQNDPLRGFIRKLSLIHVGRKL